MIRSNLSLIMPGLLCILIIVWNKIDNKEKYTQQSLWAINTQKINRASDKFLISVEISQQGAYPHSKCHKSKVTRIKSFKNVKYKIKLYFYSNLIINDN